MNQKKKGKFFYSNGHFSLSLSFIMIIISIKSTPIPNRSKKN